MKTKTCFKCGRHLSIGLFYKHSQMADGHLGKCKECTKHDVVINRKANLDYYREYDRYRYHSNDKCRRDYIHKNNKLIRLANPQKNKARYTLRNAIRGGRILKQGTCSICGSKNNIEAHHPDYTKPLAVEWLCRECHVKETHGNANQT